MGIPAENKKFATEGVTPWLSFCCAIVIAQTLHTFCAPCRVGMCHRIEVVRGDLLQVGLGRKRKEN